MTISPFRLDLLGHAPLAPFDGSTKTWRSIDDADAQELPQATSEHLFLPVHHETFCPLCIDLQVLVLPCLDHNCPPVSGVAINLVRNVAVDDEFSSLQAPL